MPDSTRFPLLKTLALLSIITMKPFSSSKAEFSYRKMGYRLSTSLLISGIVAASFDGFLPRSAQAAPTRRDWCGTVWSVENQRTLAWINPTTGVTTSASGPTTQITMPGGSMGTAVAAIGIHKESGTMYAFDRNGPTGTLYKYRFGFDSGWTAVSISGLLGLTGTQTIAGASNNLNKMTVDGNTLFVAESNGVAVYAIPLNSSGTVVGGATVQTYSFVDDPVGTPPHRSSTNTDPTGTEIINGGDIVTDEYGDVYNITYNAIISYSGTTQVLTTTKAYFYQQDPVAKTWVYQGQTTGNAGFAGAAFYRGDLYVKAGTQLKKVDLTRAGSGYTGWNNALVNVGGASTTSSGDLTACGTPLIELTKTRQVYSDAALTTLVADQNKVKPGQYIQYTVAAKNIGDAWARSTQIIDNLPTGTAYQSNSAALNGVNLSLSSYPTGGFTVNSPSITAGIVRYPTDPDTATLTFAVQVTATSGTVTNRATTTYLDNDGLTSDPPVCTSTPKVNCGEDTPITVFTEPPETNALNAPSQGNPGGTTKVQVPDLAGSDPEDGVLGSGNSFKIVTLPNNGTLYYNNIAVTVDQVIENYDPTKLTIDPNDGALTVSFIYAAIDSAGQSDPTPATVLIPFTVTASTCPTLITGEFGGGFGTINSTTKYRNLQSPVAGYAYTAPTNTAEGQYIVTSAAYGSSTWNFFGQNMTGHTTGAVDDAFLLVNGATTIGTFYQQTINVQPNRDLEVSVWARNWAGLQFSANPPTIALRVYAADGTTLLGSATVSNISNAASWVQAVANVNTGSNTKIVVKLQNLSTQFTGNDFAIDDFSIRSATTPCLDGIASDPNVLLVKRITAINGGTSNVGGDSLAGYIDALTNPYDDNSITIPTQPNPIDPPKDTDKWPNPITSLIGGINGGNIKPGDEMEYTIYFLSAGAGEAKNVLFCDRVPTNVSFMPTAFNSATPAAGGLAGDRGILSLINGTTAAFTNIADGDAARYFPPGTNPTSVYPNLNCGGTNSNGAIVVNLGNLPNATAPGTPAGAFGFVRFKGRVK